MALAIHLQRAEGKNLRGSWGSNHPDQVLVLFHTKESNMDNSYQGTYNDYATDSVVTVNVMMFKQDIVGSGGVAGVGKDMFGSFYIVGQWSANEQSFDGDIVRSELPTDVTSSTAPFMSPSTPMFTAQTTPAPMRHRSAAHWAHSPDMSDFMSFTPGLFSPATLQALRSTTTLPASPCVSSDLAILNNIPGLSTFLMDDQTAPFDLTSLQRGGGPQYMMEDGIAMLSPPPSAWTNAARNIHGLFEQQKSLKSPQLSSSSPNITNSFAMLHEKLKARVEAKVQHDTTSNIGEQQNQAPTTSSTVVEGSRPPNPKKTKTFVDVSAKAGVKRKRMDLPVKPPVVGAGGLSSGKLSAVAAAAAAAAAATGGSTAGLSAPPPPAPPAPLPRPIGNNQGDKIFSSQYRGVLWDTSSSSFRVKIKLKQKVWFLGTFHEELEAARCYDAAARYIHGSHAQLNFPSEVMPISVLRKPPPEWVVEAVNAKTKVVGGGTTAEA